MIDFLFNYVYRLDYADLLRWGLLFLALTCYLQSLSRNHRWVRPVWTLMLILWAAAVLHNTVWSREGGGDYYAAWIPFHSYRTIMNGGDAEIFHSNLMNIALFFPAGVLLSVLLPRSWSVRRHRMAAILICMCFSLSIELTQYFLALGHFEADDILHNTLGAFFGFMILPPESPRRELP